MPADSKQEKIEFLSVLKAIFRQLIPKKKELEPKVQLALYNRALMAKIGYISALLMMMFCDDEYTGLDEEPCTEVNQRDCIGTYNKELLDKTKYASG